MKYLKWLLLVPIVGFPFACLRPNPSYEPSDSPYSGLLWMGLILVCTLLVLLTRNRWSPSELAVATLAARACQFILLLFGLFMPQNLFYILFLAFTNPIYYMITLPGSIVGLSAILRCRKAGIITPERTIFHIILQFIPCVDMANAIWIFSVCEGHTLKRNKELIPKGRQTALPLKPAPIGLTIAPHQPALAIAIMREVAAWGREKGLRVWPDERLTREALFTDEAGPENFYVGTVDGREACAFILQWSDREYWPDAPEFEAGYLHKMCVRREFAHMGMTARVVEALKTECARRGAKYLRLDTGYDEPVVRDIYLAAGFEIVRTLERNGKPVMLLYELKL